jgi:hypothetical protein
MSRLSLAVSVLAAALLVAGSSLAAEKKHVYEQQKEAIAKLAKLTVSDFGLVLDRAAWGASGGRQKIGMPNQGMGRVQVFVGAGGGNQSGADKLFWGIAAAAGVMGRSSATINNTKTLSFSGKLAGELKTAGESVKLGLREDGGAAYDLDLTDDGKGTLRLVVSTATGDVLLFLQLPSGVVSAALIRNGKATGTQARSFRELYERDPAFVEAHLFPMLRSASVGLPPPLTGEEVVAEVCRQLRPTPAADREAYAKLLAELDHTSYDRREAASKKLAEQYARFAPMIEKTLDLDQPPSEEVVTRLKDIYTAQSGAAQLAQLVKSLDLIGNARYLARALDQTKAADRAAMVARLQKLTGQKIGNDPDAWEAWAATAGGRTPQPKRDEPGR